MSEHELTEAERVLIAEAGDHHPEVCDCRVYASDGGYPDHDICTGLGETYQAVERILADHLAAAEARGAQAVRERVEAWCSKTNAYLGREHPFVADLRAALSDPGTSSEEDTCEHEWLNDNATEPGVDRCHWCGDVTPESRSTARTDESEEGNRG